MNRGLSNYIDFKKKVVAWVKTQKGVVGAVVVGSYARGEQTPESDIDVIVFCMEPKHFIDDNSWLKLFGKTTNVAIEKWGAIQTVRAFFESGIEIEFSFSLIRWADIPVEPGTFRVVSDGFDILYDPTEKLAKLKHEVNINRACI